MGKFVTVDDILSLSLALSLSRVLPLYTNIYLSLECEQSVHKGWAFVVWLSLWLLSSAHWARIPSQCVLRLRHAIQLLKKETEGATTQNQNLTWDNNETKAPKPP